MTWNPTHRVPDAGLPSFVNNQPSTPLDPGLEVEVAEQSGEWARGGCLQWLGVLDRRGVLLPLAAAAAPVAAVAASGLRPRLVPAGPTAPAAAGSPACLRPTRRGGGAGAQGRRSGPPWIPSSLIGVIILLLVVGGAGGGYFFLNANAADVSPGTGE